MHLNEISASDTLTFSPWQKPDHAWYAIQTRSRHEKGVEQRLKSQGVATYLPLMAQVHRWSDRRKLVQVPLFPGYAFIHTNAAAETIAKVNRTHGVVGVLGASGCATPIPDQEIENIQILVANGASWENYPFLQVGQRVRIRGGAFDGVEGVLLEKKGENRLVVSIELIQRSLAVRLEGCGIERA
jgi:transcription elongation factor/antiterminator RfaH